MNATASRVALRLPAAAPLQGWRERMHGERLDVTQVGDASEPAERRETQVALELRPYEIALVESP
jgi:hypothetical protein